MRTVLHLLPDLGPHGHAQQVALLAPRLPRDQYRVQVVTFRDSDFFREPLYSAGIPVFVLGPQRPFTPTLWIALRRLINQQRPDLIQPWGGRALRLAVVATLGLRTPIIATDVPLTSRTGWFDRWCVNRAKRIVSVAGAADAKTTVLPFAVDLPLTIADRAAMRQQLDLTANTPVFLYAGAIESSHGWRDAVALFDILSHVDANTVLLVAGDGPDSSAMAECTAKLGLRQVRRLGWRRDFPDVLSAADAVFIFGASGGRNLALQAMAAGVPVIAWPRPDLVEILGDAAVFATRADLQSTATATRRLIESPAWRDELIERGRSRAVMFRPEGVVTKWVEMYKQT